MENIRIGSSIYDIETQILGISEKYLFDNEGYKLETNLLKTGLFGWLIESFATLATNSLLYKSAIDAERFPNTAILPKNIYNFATIYQSDIGLAQPALMKAVLLIKKTDIAKARVLNLSEFYIERDTVFSIDKVDFLLPAAIKLIGTTGKYDITKKNLTNLKNFSLDASENLYLKSYPFFLDGVEFLAIEVDLIQVKKNSIQNRVLSEDISQNIEYTITVSQQLADFKVFYQNSEDSEKIEIQKYYSSTPLNISENDEFFCNYNYTDRKNLKIIFPAIVGNFRPSLNSLITIESYETLGKGGNFSYSGEIDVTFKNLVYQKVAAFGRALTDSVGGMNEESLDTIKKNYLKKITRSSSLVSPTDLVSFINETFSNTFPQSKISVSKIQDDVIRRLYRLYFLPKDVDGNVIPANTVELDILPKDETTTNGIVVVPAGKYFIQAANTLRIYDGNGASLFSDLGISEPSGYTIAEYQALPDDFLVYRNPFLILVRQIPFFNVSTYRTSINEFFPLTANYVNMSSTDSFLINKILIQRNDMTDSTYVFTFLLKTTLDTVSVSLKIYDTEDNILSTTVCTGDEDGVYTCSLTSDDTFDANGNYNVGSAYLPENIVIKLLVTDTTTSSLVYTVETPVLSLYSSLESISKSFLGIDNYSGYKRVSGVLALESSYLSNPENFNSFLDQFYDFEKNIKNVLDKVENGNEFDLKFYNTFGRSKIYETVNVALTLNLTIELKVAYSEELNTNIRNYLITYINSANDREGFATSNVVTYLESKFSEIDNIVINSINGENIQKIEKKLQSLQPVIDSTNYVPEFLNLTPNNAQSLIITYKEI